MPFGLILLGVVVLLLLVGLGHRTLDRLYLTDRQALAVLAAMAAGSFVDLGGRPAGVSVQVNLGGILPVFLSLYVWLRADEAAERSRAFFATLLTTLILTDFALFVPFDPGRGGWLDPLWLFGLVAGLVAYLSGRSRRASFIAASTSVFLVTLIAAAREWAMGHPVPVNFGGGGLLDATLISAIVAVGLAEWIGETREALAETSR
ncbi:MAG: DUF1614 domain-containing protein [Limnochordaceae bacterium]|nr:DUF1614 domain-containing protein [Limnochordaceae bacterium]